ncbi:MAG: ATP-dependent sacrificial sulfur transferase LarE [Clostridia bacterium]|nr:ATP-dependent sacrificial sulfur transferase LarE [Clostridia bacterium]NCC44821.1 ATP-dependent sacrificial sulfur transferase LarE [Clostridia bacterium]
MEKFQDKKDKLMRQLMEDTKNPVCLALSGGVDSSLLASLIGKCADKNGTKAYGVTFETVLHPAADLPAAKAAAKESGLIHEVIHVNELGFEAIKSNPKNRCYICKKGLFEQLIDFAGKHGAAIIYEGTNYDDLSQYRPGLDAVRELGVHSPLLDAGLTKAEIRTWAQELGISSAKRPSSPCMATRLPYGAELDLDILRRIEKAENAIKELGFVIVRVRLHGDVVRIEVGRDEMQKAFENASNITSALKALDFKYITLDMEGFRSGSMDL